MGDFDADTRLEGADGRYRITLSRDWEIWGPNGGYLAAIALRAAGMEAAIKRPASVSCHFLSIARFEEVELEVRALQKGCRAESFHVVMSQAGRPILQAMVRTATAGPGYEHDFAKAPDVPGPEGLPSYAEIFADEEPNFRFWFNFEGRPPYPERVKQPEVASEPVTYDWQRFVPRSTFDDPFVDAARSLVFLDTMSWPAASRPHPRPLIYNAPNLDVTAWFHRLVPEAEWLLVDHAGPIAEGGLAGTHGRIWTADGRLLATGGAQLLFVPAPPELPSK